jgi:hypothetical protein
MAKAREAKIDWRKEGLFQIFFNPHTELAAFSAYFLAIPCASPVE